MSATGVRKFGAAARSLARGLLGEDIPAPPPIMPVHRLMVAAPHFRAAGSFAKVVADAGGKVRVWDSKPGVTVRKLTPERVTELAAEAGIKITSLRPQNAFNGWMGARILEPVAWRTRGYFALKLPLAVIGLAVIAICWLGGVFCLTFPPGGRSDLARFGGAMLASLSGSFTLVPLGAALLLAGPWAMRSLTEVDLWLMQGLLGYFLGGSGTRAEPGPGRGRAPRLRTIERDLHDGTQAQLVAVAMKLGLARDKLYDASGVDLARVTQLVEDAHRGALEAIADLRTLARGIHPPVLDNGLADALATLANRSAVPVELVTDIPERPSAAIETIAYFSAAELLANVATAQRREARYPRGRARPRPAAGPRHRRRRRRCPPGTERRPARPRRARPHRGRPHRDQQPARRPHDRHRRTPVPRLKAR